uniref:TSA: Wollemia nobilis Ref_Wollemi_Transcript_12845_2365 transcribed RNA sequence n=1 Tax=Wollemia nobilis TaxID=56998 RepID=A0A0C9S7S7_9CONI
MDFDEYEYLEKAVENSEAVKDNGRMGGDEDDKERGRSSKHRRGEEDGHGLDHRSKRARSDEERSEKERERSERDRVRSDRDRERDKDRERERERSRRGSSHARSSPELRSRDLERVERESRHRSSKERPDRNGRDRDKDRDRDREKEREREREREREKEKEKERERERFRRSRSRSERRRSSERHRIDREKSRERELRERERERELRERESRRFKERKEEPPEPEADPERDQRTVFAYQICLKADERDVYEFFSRAGKVRDVRLIMDRNSRRSKGVGYIEFYDAMSVPMAIALSGQLLLGQPVMVKPSEAEKNLVQSNAAVAGAGGLIGPYSGGARRLYVGNLHFNITEDQLRQVFEPFGTVELVQLPTDPETGQCKGFGFVQFARLEDARAAQSLNGQLEIAGRVIKVSAVSDQVGMQDLGANAGDFDDDDGGGISLNARSRALLMQKLDRSGIATSVAGSVATAPLANPALSHPTAVPGISPLAQPVVPAVGSVPNYMGLQNSTMVVPAVAPAAVDPIGVPSDCLLLKNMFDPKNETEPDFDLDIKEDVQDECSKFGAVLHIFVDKYSSGHVYLRFDNATSAVGAQRALHGRWFAGKMITATFMTSSSYEAKFPDIK